jgi:hypothetical protein
LLFAFIFPALIARIERDHRGQQRLILVDQVAQRQVVAADATFDRGGNLRETEVQVVDFETGLGGFQRRICLLFLRPIGIDVHRADGAGRSGEFFGPGIIGDSQLQLRVVQVELPFGLIQLGLVGSRINLEQQIPFLYVRPFFERYPDDIAGDSWDDTHRIHGVGLTRVVDIVGDILSDGLGNGNHWQFGRSDVRRHRTTPANNPRQERAATHDGRKKPVVHCQNLPRSEQSSCG